MQNKDTKLDRKWLTDVHLLIDYLQQLGDLLKISEHNPKYVTGPATAIQDLFINIYILLGHLNHTGEMIHQIIVASDIDSRMKALLIEEFERREGKCKA